MKSELTEELQYSEHDAEAIFSKVLGRGYEIPKGFVDVKFAKSDVVAGLEYLCGDKELAEISVECYGAEKRAIFVEETAVKIQETAQSNSQNLERKVKKSNQNMTSKIAKEIWNYTLGINFTFASTLEKELYYKEENLRGQSKMARLIFSAVVVNTFGYSYLFKTNPKLIPYILIPQIATNIASGIYETIRAKRKREEEEAKEKEREKSIEYNDVGETGTRKKCYHECGICNNGYCSFHK